MPALGSYAENLVVNALLRGISFTPPTQWFLCLYTSNPTSLDTGTEIAIGSTTNYFRQPVTFGPPSGGALSNTTDITFPIAGTSWGNITYAAIRDASTSGHLLFYGSLVTPRFIVAGDVLKFLTGNVVCTVS
jgi:hypothetical protein